MPRPRKAAQTERKRESPRARLPMWPRLATAICALDSPPVELLASLFDETHPQVVENLLEQARLGGVDVAARFLLQHAEDVDELAHGVEIRLHLVRQGVGDLAEAHQRLRAEAHHEGAEGDLERLTLVGRPVRRDVRLRIRGLAGRLLDRRSVLSRLPRFGEAAPVFDLKSLGLFVVLSHVPPQRWKPSCIFRRRSMRSSIGGCVLNRLAKNWPDSGLTMNR